MKIKRYIIKSLKILVVLIIALLFGYMMTPKYTPSDIVHELHMQDSINITTNSPLLVKNYIAKKIALEFKDAEILSTKYYYDSTAYCTKVKIDTVTYNIWARLEFYTNEGDYIINPKILNWINAKKPKPQTD